MRKWLDVLFSQKKGQRPATPLSGCLLRCLLRPQDASTPSNSTRHVCHLDGHPVQVLAGPSVAWLWWSNGYRYVQRGKTSFFLHEALCNILHSRWVVINSSKAQTQTQTQWYRKVPPFHAQREPDPASHFKFRRVSSLYCTSLFNSCSIIGIILDPLLFLIFKNDTAASATRSVEYF
jgi:hypothetical protein